MIEPVALNGHAYERECIEKYIKQKNQDIYYQPASIDLIKPLPELKAVIQCFAALKNYEIVRLK